MQIFSWTQTLLLISSRQRYDRDFKGLFFALLFGSHLEYLDRTSRKITKYILHVPFRVGQEQRTQRIFYFFSPSSPFLPPDVIQTVRRLKLRILGFLSRVFIAALLLLARRSILIIGAKTIIKLNYHFALIFDFPKYFIQGCRCMKIQIRILKLLCLIVLLLSAPLEMFLAKKSLEESFFRQPCHTKCYTRCSQTNCTHS